MNVAELKDFTPEELNRRAGEIRENLFNLKIRHAAGTLDSSADLLKNKRDLARVLTTLTQKQGSSKGKKGTAHKQAAAPSAAVQPAAAAAAQNEKKG